MGSEGVEDWFGGLEVSSLPDIKGGPQKLSEWELTASYGTSPERSGKALSNCSLSTSSVPLAPVTLTSEDPRGASSRSGKASIPLGPGAGTGAGGADCGSSTCQLSRPTSPRQTSSSPKAAKSIPLGAVGAWPEEKRSASSPAHQLLSSVSLRGRHTESGLFASEEVSHRVV